MSLDDMASELAAMLTQNWWYHRTTVVQTPGLIYFKVWAEGEGKPKEIPEFHHGYLVLWCRVSKKNPCPFGSAKEDYRT